MTKSACSYAEARGICCSTHPEVESALEGKQEVGLNTVPCLQGAHEDDLVDDNLGFSKERCISRLTEMQSFEYLIEHAKQHSPQLMLALEQASGKGSEDIAGRRN